MEKIWTHAAIKKIKGFKSQAFIKPQTQTLFLARTFSLFFEAETNGLKYQIHVGETKSHWNIKILPENEKKEVSYHIHKQDYQHLDNAISFLFKNSSYLVDIVKKSTTSYTVYTRGSFRNIEIFNDEMLLHRSFKFKENFLTKDTLISEMPGKVVKILVKPLQKVQEGEPLLIIEAMKMENEIRSSHNTQIKKIHVNINENIERGVPLVSFYQETKETS